MIAIAVDDEALMLGALVLLSFVLGMKYSLSVASGIKYTI